MNTPSSGLESSQIDRPSHQQTCKAAAKSASIAMPAMTPGMFSLILATKDRVEEIDYFFAHLVKQLPQKFECIVVDQNQDDRIVPILNRYCHQFPIIHVHSTPGLSKARNVGLLLARGEYIAFPDDDCWYPDGLLEKASQIFTMHPEWAGFTGVSVGSQNGPSRWKWNKTPGKIDRWNVWQRGISITIFFRRAVIEKIGFFNEQLGLGANSPWKSGEETDYLLRALEAGFLLYYLPDFVVHHPDDLPDYRQDVQRAFDYGAGFGRILRLHSYPIHYAFWKCFRPVITAGYSLLKLNPTRAYYFLQAAKGRWIGWYKVKP